MTGFVKLREIAGPTVRPADSGESTVLIDCSWLALVTRDGMGDVEAEIAQYLRARRGGEYAGAETPDDELAEGVCKVWLYSKFARPWGISSKQGAYDLRFMLRLRVRRDAKSIRAGQGRLQELSDVLNSTPDGVTL